MKQLLSLLISVLILVAAGDTQAKDETLFPKVDEASTESHSLDSAITQFDQIIESSTDGDLESIKVNDEYNQQKMPELQVQLAGKKEYLEAMPDIVSRQFDALMKQYADVDQKTKNKMVDDLHAKWKAKETSVKQEIAELERQLAVTDNRISDAAIKSQMLEISNSLAGTEKALRNDRQVEESEPQGESPTFKKMQDLSRKRVLSKIRGLCRIQVKPLDTELSIKYLDN